MIRILSVLPHIKHSGLCRALSGVLYVGRKEVLHTSFNGNRKGTEIIQANEREILNESSAECDAIDQTRNEQMQQLSCTFREESFIHEAVQRQFALERMPVISDLGILMLDLLKTSLKLIDTHHTFYAFFRRAQSVKLREKRTRIQLARTKLISAHTLLLSECFYCFQTVLLFMRVFCRRFREFVTHFERILTCKTCVGLSPASRSAKMSRTLVWWMSNLKCETNRSI